MGVFRIMRLIVSEAFLTELEQFAILIAAIGHDLGHPGFSNGFLTETSHELALKYNDRSPLENMHCARLFEIVSNAKTGIFSSFSKGQYQEVRKVCIEAILHTDMSHHFSMVKEVQMLYEMNSEILDASRELFYDDNSEFPTKEAVDYFRSAQDTKRLFRNLFLHVGDVSNPMKPFKICRIWAWQVLEEFFIQGDKEKELGITVQMLNDRDKVNRAFSQIGFIEFLVSPLLFAMCPVLPPMEESALQLISNATSWEHDWVRETIPTPKEEEQKGVQDRIAKLDARFRG